jgi:uncharacterized protein DUF4386
VHILAGLVCQRVRMERPRPLSDAVEAGMTRSPRARARIAGGVYLFFFVTAILGEIFVRQAGISGIGSVPADAGSAASGILAHDVAYRLGTSLGLISTASYAVLIGLLYRLMRPAGTTLAMVGAWLGILGCGVSAGVSALHFAPLVVLRGDSYLNAFDAAQLAALALLALKLAAQVNAVALVFFGLFQIAIGYVMFRATFLPRVIGVLVAVAGVFWLTVLVPPLVSLISGPIELFGGIAELSLMLWLLIFGVNSQRWHEQAGTGS